VSSYYTTIFSLFSQLKASYPSDRSRGQSAFI
jgi:hypothetical protein